MYILGLSAVTLIRDDEIVAAVQEERFTRKKHDANFPVNSIKYCLSEVGISIEDVDYIVFYDKPFLKFERLIETYLSEAPRGFSSFVMSIPIWLKDKLFLKETLSREFSDNLMLEEQLTGKERKTLKNNIYSKLRFAEHHQSHAASAYYPSPFEDAAILTVDGVGEWATTSISYGSGNDIAILKEINFPHSLGLLYSAFTYYAGFKVNSGEYKLMGLAPYGAPIYKDVIKDNIIDIKEDGSFRLDMSYFNYTQGLTMTSDKFHQLFSGEPRVRESEITQKEMDIAASIQALTEEIMISLVKEAKKITGSKNLCLAGGVALNCVANGKIVLEDIFDDVWIQPAAGDAGGSIGCAYSMYYQELKNERLVDSSLVDKMRGAFLGPKYSSQEIREYLDSVDAKYKCIDNENDLLDLVGDEIAVQKVVGWHTGRMEFGPRSLGHRSIIGDARSMEMQLTMNLKIKYRESFRPFAPSVLREKVGEWFDLDGDSPYMLLVSKVNNNKLEKICANEGEGAGLQKLKVKRSKIPAVTHVDNSARVQTVHSETNPKFHKLISIFYKKTGCPIIVNTSFNVRGEPIVCSPEDSYRCFMRTEMDVLVIDDYVLYKEDQLDFNDDDWRAEFELD